MRSLSLGLTVSCISEKGVTKEWGCQTNSTGRGAEEEASTTGASLADSVASGVNMKLVLR